MNGKLDCANEEGLPVLLLKWPYAYGRYIAAAFLFVILFTPNASALDRGVNLLASPAFESTADWQAVGEGFTSAPGEGRDGTTAIRCESATFDAIHGVSQTIKLDPPVLHSFRISGWSKAENVVTRDDYNIYVDVIYDDDSPFWGVKAQFDEGAHDWTQAVREFTPEKPVAELRVFVLFRGAMGKAWFDDIRVELTPLELSGLRVMPGVFGAGSLAIEGTASLASRWTASIVLNGAEKAAISGEGTRLSAIFPALQWSVGANGIARVTLTDSLRGEVITEETACVMPDTPAHPYAVWTESSMRRILPEDLPPAEASTQAAIALAGNEYEAFQIALKPSPEQRLTRVRVVTPELRCAENGQTLPASCWEWNRVGFVNAKAIMPHGENPAARPGLQPDPLLPACEFAVEPGFTQPLWFTLHAPAGTPPGLYSGNIQIAPEGLPPVDIPVSARVYGFDLPITGHLKTAFALMDGFLEQTYGEPLSPTLRRHYGDFVMRHRLNPDDISRTEPPPVEDLTVYRGQGMNTFNILNMVEQRGNQTWVCFSPLAAYTPDFRAALETRLDAAVAGLRQAGLADMAYIYTFDERESDYYPVMREYFGMVKSRYPEVHTLTTAQVPLDPVVMKDLNVDWMCPLTPRYDKEKARQCRAAGLQVWAYVCCGPGEPYANFMLHHPLIESRVLWWQVWEQEMDGVLYWGLNIWDRPGNRTLIPSGAGPVIDWDISGGEDAQWSSIQGDGRLIYAGVDGPIGSIRLANIRDGLEDYEYIHMLAERDGEGAMEAVKPVTTSLTQFTHDPAMVLARRGEIAGKIEAGKIEAKKGK